MAFANFCEMAGCAFPAAVLRSFFEKPRDRASTENPGDLHDPPGPYDSACPKRKYTGAHTDGPFPSGKIIKSHARSHRSALLFQHPHILGGSYRSRSMGLIALLRSGTLRFFYPPYFPVAGICYQTVRASGLPEEFPPKNRGMPVLFPVALMPLLSFPTCPAALQLSKPSPGPQRRIGFQPERNILSIATF